MTQVERGSLRFPKVWQRALATLLPGIAYVLWMPAPIHRESMLQLLGALALVGVTAQWLSSKSPLAPRRKSLLLAMVAAVLYVLLLTQCQVEHEGDSFFFPLLLTGNLAFMVETAGSIADAIERYEPTGIQDQLGTSSAVSATLILASLLYLLPLIIGHSWALQNLWSGRKGKASALRTFVAYSSKDIKALEELLAGLAPLQASGAIKAWRDTQTPPGARYQEHIPQKLADSQLVLLLLSTSFFESPDCQAEAAQALAGEAAGSMWVVPVLLEACQWKAHPVHRLQILPSDRRPLDSWEPRSAGVADVVNHLAMELRRRAVQ